MPENHKQISNDFLHLSLAKNNFSHHCHVSCLPWSHKKPLKAQQSANDFRKSNKKAFSHFSNFIKSSFGSFGSRLLLTFTASTTLFHLDLLLSSFDLGNFSFRFLSTLNRPVKSMKLLLFSHPPQRPFTLVFHHVSTRIFWYFALELLSAQCRCWLRSTPACHRQPFRSHRHFEWRAFELDEFCTFRMLCNFCLSLFASTEMETVKTVRHRSGHKKISNCV